MEPNIHPSSLQPSPTREPTKPPLPKDPYAGFDSALERRPGYSSLRGIKPWPNSRWPIEPQPRRITVFAHGRSNKTFPPLFGTDVPPSGLSGKLRELAYRYPDHLGRHWMMLMAADRVHSLEQRAQSLLPIAIPAIILGLVARARWARQRSVSLATLRPEA